MLAIDTNINYFQYYFPILHFTALPTLLDSIQGNTVQYGCSEQCFYLDYF